MSRSTALAVVALLASVEALIIWLVWSGYAETFDGALRQALLGFDPPHAIRLWRTITLLGSGIVITALSVLCVTFFVMRSDWRSARQLTFVMVGAVAVENGLKWMVQRARPGEVFAQTMPSTYSFPSGHSLFALAFYVSVALIFARQMTGAGRTVIWAAALSLTLLIGASRVFLGVHYPLDVLGGYGAAALWMILVHWPSMQTTSSGEG